MKKAIRYLRFSDKSQSHSSIERQELYTDQWLKNNNVELVDTFIDRGKSAKTFDRPDFNKLQEFIRKHYRSVDYLLVDQLDRFSRDAGDAIKMVKKLQVEFQIQIVSVTEGITYDYSTPGSFFRTGLQLLLAEEDNINRSIKARGGVYTAKAKEGRFVYSAAPFGYCKVGYGKDRHLEIDKEQGKVILFIYESFINGAPFYEIAKKARQMGFKVNGNSAIQKVLSNPVYAGYQYVKPHKEYPGGLFKAIHDPIVDYVTWQNVQQKLKVPEKTRVVLDSELPLRGVLKCYCGKLLTGAPSKGRHGKYYYYYKCNKTNHININAKRAHEQLEKILSLMSLPADMAKKIKRESKIAMDLRLKNDSQLLKDNEKELVEVEKKLMAIEEKWITNEINRETYERWFEKLSISRRSLTDSIKKMNMGQSHFYSLLERNLDKLSSLDAVYKFADIAEKQELLRIMFGGTLYYNEGLFRSSFVLEFLASRLAEIQAMGVFKYEGKFIGETPELNFERIAPLLNFLENLNGKKIDKRQMNRKMQ